VWERRYGFPQPNRDEHGERVYPAAQVEKLRVIKRLMDQGHRPGRIVAQPIQALLHLTRADALGHSASAVLPSVREDLAALIAMIQAHDDEGLRAALHESLAKTGLQSFVTHLIAPLTSLVGETWARGDLAVHQEHLYTECVATLLRQAISAIPKAASGTAPSVLLTTFPQEAHGLGLLMVESLLALQGCRCVSLGTQMPLRDIAQAAAVRKADVVALSFSVSMNVNHVIDGLKELMALLPRGVTVWAGGQSPALKRRQIEGVVVMNDLASISSAVNEWRHHAGLVA
jgi:methanogenic corrinoid protein MtbC1